MIGLTVKRNSLTGGREFAASFPSLGRFLSTTFLYCVLPIISPKLRECLFFFGVSLFFQVDLARLGTIDWSDVACLFQRVDQTGGTVVADAETAL